jgi:hypothetical protein
MHMFITMRDLPHLGKRGAERCEGAVTKTQFTSPPQCVPIYRHTAAGSAIVGVVRRFKVRKVVTEMIGREGA